MDLIDSWIVMQMHAEHTESIISIVIRIFHNISGLFISAILMILLTQTYFGFICLITLIIALESMDEIGAMT